MKALFIVLLLSFLQMIPYSSAGYSKKRGKCPKNWFNIQFVSVAEKVVPPSAIELMPDLSFFKNVMKYSPRKIEKVTNDALMFFKNKYGIDFTQVEPDELGKRETETAIFNPFQLSPEVEYNIMFNTYIFNGRRYSKCYENRDGGFAVSFKTDQKLFGTYGGSQGKPITTNDLIVYGFYNIPVRFSRKPLIIRYTSGSPARLETNDGFQIINCDLYSPLLGHGTAQGVFRSTPEANGQLRVSIRNLFTFPMQPRQLYSYYYFA